MTGEEGGGEGEGEENCHPLITSLLNEGAVIKNTVNSSPYIPLQGPRAAHALRLDQNAIEGKNISTIIEFIAVFMYFNI